MWRHYFFYHQGKEKAKLYIDTAKAYGHCSIFIPPICQTAISHIILRIYGKSIILNAAVSGDLPAGRSGCAGKTDGVKS